MSNNAITVAPVSSRFQGGWRKHAYRTLAVVLGLSIAGGMAELALRVVGYGRSYVCPFGAFHQADPVLGWRGKPNFSGRWHQGDFDVFIALTEDGFRKLEHRKPPTEVKNTVYVLGDSFAWGWGTAQGENFADQMNLLMPNQQVENFGLAGVGTVPEYAIFAKHVQPRLRPGDTVLLAFCSNDFFDNIDRNRVGVLHAEVRDGKVQVVQPVPGDTLTELTGKMKDWSYVFNLLAYSADRYGDHRARGGMAWHERMPLAKAAALSPNIPDAAPEVQVTRCYLEKFKQACADRAVRLVVAYIPGQGELGEDDVSAVEDLSFPEQIGYRKAFFRCAEQLALETIDLLPHFCDAKKAKRFDRFTFRRDCHWTKDGHTVAAETIASILLAGNKYTLRGQH